MPATTTVEERARLNAIATILSEMMLKIFFTAYDSYWMDHEPPDANIGKALVQWLVSMSLRVNSQNGGLVSISKIARDIRMPRINVKRHLDALGENGVVVYAEAEDGDGYRSNGAYVDRRADHFIQMTDAVHAAHEKLRALH